MKYPDFIYQCAKAGADYGDDSMTYPNFILGNMKDDQDYSPYLDKTYHEANAFLQRVSALGKVPCGIKEFGPIGADTAAELVMDSDFLTAVSVFQYDDESHRKYTTLPFRKLGNKVYVLGRYSPYRKIYVQYRPKIPVFSKSNIAFVTEVSTVYYTISVIKPDGTSLTETADNVADALRLADDMQVDLADYGITDEVLLIGVDWVRGRLRDDVSKGHSEEVEAESRLNDVESDEFIYAQTKGGRVLG